MVEAKKKPRGRDLKLVSFPDHEAKRSAKNSTILSC